MISDAQSRRTAFVLVSVLILAGGVLRFQQAWSHRAVYLPDSIQEEGYYETGIGLLSYQAFGVGVPDPGPTSWRGPIYPVFIASIEALSPEPDPGRIRLAQAALSSLSILLIFALGSAIYSPTAGLFGAALLAFDARQVEAVTSLNIHGFYSFLILTACAALLLWSERSTAKSTVLAGAFIGFTLLCRSAHYPLLPFIAVSAWFWRPLPGPRWRAPAYLILGAALALAPMTARNLAVAKRWLVFPDLFAGAVALFGATTGQQGLASYSVDQVLDMAEAAEPGFRMSTNSKAKLHPAILDMALRRVARAPFRFAGLCLRRLGLLWRSLWLPLALGLAGLALQRKNRRFQIAVLIALSFSGYCVAGGDHEHQTAVKPLLFLVAGCGGAVLLGRLIGPVSPAPSKIRGWLRAVLAAGPALGLFLYAVFLITLAGEARQRLWRGEQPPFAREDRALAILRRRAEQRREPARRQYIGALTKNAQRWAAAGDCAKAMPKLRRSLLLDPRQAAAAGTLAACLAAEGEESRARSLAVVYQKRPALERADFFGIWLTLSERLGGKTTTRILTDALKAEPESSNIQAPFSWLLAESWAPADAMAARAFRKLSQGDGEGWRADFQEALRRNAKRVCSNPESVHSMHSDIRFFDACLATLPDEPQLLSDRGVARFLEGNSMGALFDFRRSLELRPSNLGTGMSLAVALGRSGTSEAAVVLDRALSSAASQRDSPLYEKAARMRNSLRGVPPSKNEPK